MLIFCNYSVPKVAIVLATQVRLFVMSSITCLFLLSPIDTFRNCFGYLFFEPSFFRGTLKFRNSFINFEIRAIGINLQHSPFLHLSFYLLYQ